jgi:hypothetical protein
MPCAPPDAGERRRFSNETGVISGLGRAAVLTAALFSWSAAAACAEPVETTLSVTVNALSGAHQVNGGHSDQLNFAPLPLAELIVRRGSESLRVEGLPPITFGYGSAGDGASATRLSIINATYRHAFGGGWFAGAGETIYNQFTTYAPVHGTFVYERGGAVESIDGAEAQYSRVTGMRFEAGRALTRGRERIEYSAAVNARMRGIQYTQIPTFSFVCSGTPSRVCSRRIDTFADPENASQVDVAVRAGHRISKHGELLYGVRYLNYTAHYDDFPGQLADRNVGFAPLLGYRLRL